MKMKLLICVLSLGVVALSTSESYGWCEKPVVEFIFYPACHDEVEDIYYIGYDKVITQTDRF